MTEFEKDMKELAEYLVNKDTSKFRKKIWQMFEKMQTSNTKEYYREKIDSLCKTATGESYEKLFLLGIPR